MEPQVFQAPFAQSEAGSAHTVEVFNQTGSLQKKKQIGHLLQPAGYQAVVALIMLSFMDEDLNKLSFQELLFEAKRLRQAIRSHRDSQMHELCWYHPEMWNLLPDTKEVRPMVPNREQFLKGCHIYRASLDRDFDSTSQIDAEYRSR